MAVIRLPRDDQLSRLLAEEGRGWPQCPWQSHAVGRRAALTERPRGEGGPGAHGDAPRPGRRQFKADGDRLVGPAQRPKFTPEELCWSALAQQDAEAHSASDLTGLRSPCRPISTTISAGHAQRRPDRRVEAERILNEPTAAALACGFRDPAPSECCSSSTSAAERSTSDRRRMEGRRLILGRQGFWGEDFT